MLRGAHAITLDNKGRLAIPARYRDWLRDECDGQLICTLDLVHPCLLLYPLTEWEHVEHRLRQLSSLQVDERRLQRLLLGNATECELDGNGRILLPAPLRRHARLERDVMLAGQLNKFEIWDANLWQQQIAEDIAALPQSGWQQSDKLRDFTL